LGEKESLALAKLFAERLNNSEAEIIVAPSFLYFEQVKDIFEGTTIRLAGQNVSAEGKGADTGEISAEMLKKAGADYVIVGHSERRHKLGESDALIHEKLGQCVAAGLIPILCVGETIEEKRAGQRDEVLSRQLRTALVGSDLKKCPELFIAYEPVWAIYPGDLFPAEELFTVFQVVQKTLSALFPEEYVKTKLRLLYGGSVNIDICEDFWKLEYLSGLLIGNASTKEKFVRIVERLNS